jgi:hypothetical protein
VSLIGQDQPQEFDGKIADHGRLVEGREHGTFLTERRLINPIEDETPSWFQYLERPWHASPGEFSHRG